MGNTKRFGYVRVSSKDQNEDRQMEAMKNAGVNERDIYVEKASGKDFKRQKYQALKNTLREGDTVYIKSLDRLGRNKDMILEEWKWFKDNNIDVVVLDMPILDTRKYREIEGIGTLVTDIVLNVLSWVAQDERERIKTRQAEGIAIAKAKGKHLGRPKKIIEKSEFEKVYTNWKKGDITAVQAMKELNLTKGTFYNRVKEFEARVK